MNQDPTDVSPEQEKSALPVSPETVSVTPEPILAESEDEVLGYIPDRNNPGQMTPLTHAELDRRMEDIDAKSRPLDEFVADVHRIASGDATVEKVIQEIDRRTTTPDLPDVDLPSKPEPAIQTAEGAIGEADNESPKLSSTVQTGLGTTASAEQDGARKMALAELVPTEDGYVLVRPGTDTHTVRMNLTATDYDAALDEARGILKLNDQNVDPAGTFWDVR